MHPEKTYVPALFKGIGKRVVRKMLAGEI